MSCFFFLKVSVIVVLEKEGGSKMPTEFHGRQWLDALSVRQGRARELFAKTPEEQQQSGYLHTLPEICRQPQTWRETCELMIESAVTVNACLREAKSLIFTGSGSSEYAGDCVRAGVQAELGIDCQVIGGGVLLTEKTEALPVCNPRLMVSLARSGDSPESTGALSLMLKHDPEMSHLVLTCNNTGALARTYHDDARVSVITLGEDTNDQSLVMTGSFTNLIVAARFLGLVKTPDAYRAICDQAASIAADVFSSQFDTLAQVAESGFKRVVYLGSGSRYGVACEAALKMLEMTAGRVTSLYESYLGLRHGPMSYLDSNTLVVCFLSSDQTRRSYETDLLRELSRKRLGVRKLIVGEAVPADVTRPEDVVVECCGLKQLGDRNAVLVDAVVAQLLAFFRCLQEGLHPDSPSRDNVINRVVQRFPLYGM
jgi:tagatose-6-phosphate ketose/aldose isomerase